MHILRISWIFFGLLLLTGCTRHSISHEKTPADQLREKIEYLINDPNLFNAQIGVYLESLRNGEVLFARNEHRLFISASNMKIYTTAVALLNFGPDFRYNTDFYISGDINNRVLSGDVVVRGKGDPSITARFHDGDVINLLSAWIDSLKNNGIEKISGNLIGDASYFQNPPLGAGWQWDDEPFWYSAQINALSMNDNCIDVTVYPGTHPGIPPVVELSPPTSFFKIENDAVTAEADSNTSLFITRPRHKNILQIKNRIPVSRDKYTESISVEDPARFFIHVLAEQLEQKGITLEGELIVQDNPRALDYNQYKLLFSYASPKLEEIIRVVNKRSQNLYAEQLLLTLAAEYGGKASARAGTDVVTARVGRMGIPETEFRMQDGSGLARKNLISPSGTATLLRYMYHHSYKDYFYDSLPVAGVDGTLKYRMKGSTAVNNVHAKTGYVGYARNLSGYVTSRDGEEFVFSILVNNYTIPTPAVNLLQDRICTAVSEFRR
jgi:D-alanyl-D-alanine carboxypeptidase/D-alanyl-D-alanine-endopeptidase (penicillin-binding protein 4)